MAKKDISVQGSVRRVTVEGQLESLLTALKKGHIFVQKGNEYVELTVPAMLEIEIEASQTKSKERLRLEISWARQEVPKESEDAAAHFKILESAPVIDEAAPTSES